MSALPPKDGVIGRRSCGQLKDFWVLRFRLMVKRGHRCTGGPKHQKEKRSMDYFAGLDVSVKETSVCIVVIRWLRLSEQNFRVDKWSLCRG